MSYSIELTPTIGKTKYGNYKILTKQNFMRFGFHTKNKIFKPKVTILGKFKSKFIKPVQFYKDGLLIYVENISVKNDEDIFLSMEIENRTDNYIKLNTITFYIDNYHINLPIYDHTRESERESNILYNKTHEGMPRMVVLPKEMVKVKSIRIAPHTNSKIINMKISINSHNQFTLEKMINLLTQPVTKDNSTIKYLNLAIAMTYSINGNKSSLFQLKKSFLWEKL